MALQALRRIGQALALAWLAGGAAALQGQTLGAPSTLEFGEVVLGSTGGTLTLDPSTGAITSAVGVYPTSALGTTFSVVTATDKGGRIANVYTTASTFTLTGSGGGSFSSNTSPYATNYPGDQFTFPGTSSQTTQVTFQVGGTITLPAGQASGDYTGYLPIYIADNKGANSNTVSIPVHIRIVAPIALSKTQDLDMGTVIPGASAGQVILNATTGALNTTGGVLYASATGQPASFSVTGAPNHAFNVSFTASTITLTGSAGSMNLSLASSLTNPASFSGAGTATLGIGGTLAVGANQPEGDYTGTFTVTVAYP